MKKYDFKLDLDTINSLTEIIKRINPNSKILEIGSSYGRLTRYLKEELNCNITIVEIDEEAGINASKYSEKYFLGSIDGDVEKLSFINELDLKSFDYIIFADVLEHLRNPEEVLLNMKKLLKKDGSIILSVPNISHNSILIDLFNNKFEYQEIGLLDNTHIHFFTYDSIKKMVLNCNYYLKDISMTVANVGEIEIKNTYFDIPIEVENALKKRKLGNVYQFILELQNYDGVKKIKENFIKFENNIEVNTDRVKVQLFYKNEYGYDEKNSVLVEKKDGKLLLKLPENLKEFRFDPSDTAGILYLKNINSEIISTNAISVCENLLFFNTNDPQIYLKNDELDVFEIDYEFYKLTDKELAYVNYFNIKAEETKKIVEEIKKVTEETKKIVEEIKKATEETKKNG